MTRKDQILIARFTNETLQEISDSIDEKFKTLIDSYAPYGKVSAEIKSSESKDDEYRYLVVEDELIAIAFIRRTDLNHFELFYSSKIS